MNRKTRRAHAKAHRVEVKQAVQSGSWGEWEDVLHLFQGKLADRPEIHRLKKYVKNNVYSAQVIDTPEGMLLGIRRHDQSTDVPWAHKQRIKNEVLGREWQAIEVFPKESELVDDANMYWLWVVNINVDLKGALRGVYSK